MAEVTKTGQLNAPIGRIKLVSALPTTVVGYYGGSGSLADDEWRGGEVVYHVGSGTGSAKLYIQTATSGKTATWKRYVTAFTSV